MSKGNPNSNYPTSKFTKDIESVDGYIHDTVKSIAELSSRGKPDTVDELRARINHYFDFCADSGFRPGIESLSLSLHVDRSTFWRWCNSELGVSEEWSEVCRIARQSIVAFTEAAAYSGHLSPPIAIFALKNIANYKDALSFEDLSPMSEERKRKLDFERVSAYRLPDLNDLEDGDMGNEL